MRLTLTAQGGTMKNMITLLFLMFATTAIGANIELNETNTIVLNTAINSSTAAQVQVKAMELSAKNPKQDLYLVLDSPGGSVTAGALMIDTLNALPNKIHTISLFSASMAYQTVQSLGTRYVLRSSTLMSHRAFLGGVKGTFEQLDSIISLYKQHVNNFDIVAANRTGQSLEEYKKLIHDDYWVTGAKSVEAKHADVIANVTCGKSLRGTNTRIVHTFFGNFEVTFSSCPIVRGYLSARPVSRDVTRKSYQGGIDELNKMFNDRTRANISYER